jgi:protein disulfide-isomerase A6
MKITFLAFFFLLSIASATAVQELTPDNFYSVVDGSKGAFVKFYAPWCGHCKNLAPEYEIVGDVYKPHSSSVVVAKVDCDAHGDLCSNFGVTGYPTLKWFPQGRAEEPEAYQGGRSADDIISFINGKTGLKARVKKAPSQVVELNDENFDKVVLDSKKHVFVEFFAPWCGHCKKLAPEWEKLGQVFANEEDVIIAKYDADAHKDKAQKYGITGFPTLKWFPKENKEGEPYGEGRDLESLVDFVNKNAGKNRQSNGLLPETAGRVEALDAIASKFIASSDRAGLLKEAKTIAAGLTGADATSGKFYTHVMQKVIDNGDSFVENETGRIQRMIASGSVVGPKVDEFSKRLNILEAFTA